MCRPTWSAHQRVTWVQVSTNPVARTVKNQIMVEGHVAQAVEVQVLSSALEDTWVLVYRTHVSSAKETEHMVQSTWYERTQLVRYK